MNKLNFTKTLAIIFAMFLTLFIVSCNKNVEDTKENENTIVKEQSNLEDKINTGVNAVKEGTDTAVEKEVNAGTDSVNSGADTATDNTKEQLKKDNKVAPTIYFIDENNPIQASIEADTNINAEFLTKDNDIYKVFQSKLKEAANNKEILTIEPSEEGKKQGVEALKIPVVEHYPIMVFQDKDKENTKIDLELIKKEQPDIVITHTVGDTTYFAFKDPFFISGVKRVKVLDETKINEIYDSSILVTGTVDETKENLVLVEDPLCPYCASSFNSEKMTEAFEKYNVYVLPLALKIHPNADKLSSIWLNNKENPDILNIVKHTFEKQQEFAKADYSKLEDIKALYDNAEYNYSMEGYNEDFYNKLAVDLEVRGTPTIFKLNGNKVTLVGDYNKEL